VGKGLSPTDRPFPVAAEQPVFAIFFYHKYGLFVFRQCSGMTSEALAWNCAAGGAKGI